MSGPMTGVKVVELGVWVAGPATGGILADWGADVVKIEPPSGYPARMFQKILGGDLPTNPVFELDNRSKRGIALDLTSEEGLEVALDLIAEADVFVTNLRIGALERLGLGAASVSHASSTATSPATAGRATTPTGPPTTWRLSGPARGSPTS